MSVKYEEDTITEWRKATDKMLSLRPHTRRRELLDLLDAACKRGDLRVVCKIEEGE